MKPLTARISKIWETIATYKLKGQTLWLIKDASFTLSAGIIFALIISGISALINSAFGEFFYKNEKILDIYWNTILIALTLLLPFSIEIIHSLKDKYSSFGVELYFLSKGIKIHKIFWLLPSFSFTLIFLINFNSHTALDLNLMVFIHAFGFYLWATFFWYILGILFKSINIMLNNNESMNEMFFDRLNDSGSNQQIEEKWKAVWGTIDSLTEEWRRKFLGLFWQRQSSLISNSSYEISVGLFEDFANLFLALKDKDSDTAILYNFRKKWLWFHEKISSDGRENPYSVFIRLLEVYKIVYFKDRTGSGAGIFRLFEVIKRILEGIITKEVKETDDFYYSFFRQLKLHISENSTTKRYLASLPIYRPILENANNHNLSRYEPGSNTDGFPNSWRITTQNLTNSSEESSGDKIMREIWYQNFHEWAAGRIQHEVKKYDSELDGALELLFPEAYNSWLALAFGYRVLSWSGSRVESLCNWDRNFGSGSVMGDSYWYDPIKTEQENELEMQKQMQEKIEAVKTEAALTIKRLGLLGSISEIEKVNIELKAYRPTEQKTEQTRQELVELTDKILSLP